MAEDKKLIKMRCKKTGKYVIFDCEKNGGSYQVVNFDNLTDENKDMYPTTLKPDGIVTSSNLLPCRKCGSRKIASCSCGKSLNICKDNKFHFQCAYCDELVVEYSHKEMSPYNKWAGVSNIPTKDLDKYGNPLGSEYDLAQDDSFKGYKILVLDLCYEHRKYNIAFNALKKKGFEIEKVNDSIAPLTLKNKLKDCCQLWIIDNNVECFNRSHIDVIIDYYRSGHGLYLWCDNDPFFQNCNLISEELFDAKMQGDYIGQQNLGISFGKGQPGIIKDHLISTGIQVFYEGVTISHLEYRGQDLKPLVYSSDGNIVTAYCDKDNCRLLIDGGFTRLYDDWGGRVAGTERFVVNCAAWLANIERFGYNNN